MDVVNQWDEIPVFRDERAESEFWATHRLAPKLMDESVAGGGEGESTSITLRIDPRMLARIKRLARSRYLNYQSMIKQWLSERMEAEFRERSPMDVGLRGGGSRSSHTGGSATIQNSEGPAIKRD